MNNLITKTDGPFFDYAKKFFGNSEFDFNPFIQSNGGLSNISEKDNEYLVELSAPGLKKDDIKIELDNDILKISSSVEDKKEENSDGYYRREFYKSSFERNFTIPKNTDKTKILATMEDGILKVSIPKTEVKKENIKIVIK